MKIAIVSPKAFPVFRDNAEGGYGGAEIALSLVARILAAREDYDVHMLVGDYGQADTELIDGITFHKALSANGSGVTNALRLMNTVRRIKARVYVQRTLTVASTVLSLFCRARGARFVYWVAHDSETDGGHPLYHRLATRLAVRSLYRTASLVIVQNEYERRQLSDNYPTLRTALIKKGIELPGNEAMVEAEIDAVWVGRCDEWKHPELFVDLAAIHPELKFVMICPPATSKESYHRGVMEKAAKVSNLQVLGRTANPEVLRYVARSRVFCITSSQEGDWPVVVLEAASLRRPILSLALNYAGLIDEYGGGYCCGGDLQEMSDRLQSLIRNDDERRTAGQGAYDYVKTMHDSTVQAELLVEQLRELAG